MSNVEHPSHYVHGEHDLLYHLKDILTPEEYRGAMKFNIIKYVTRYQDKNGIEDLKKMLFYGQDLLDYENKQKKQEVKMTHDGPIKTENAGYSTPF